MTLSITAYGDYIRRNWIYDTKMIVSEMYLCSFFFLSFFFLKKINLHQTGVVSTKTLEKWNYFAEANFKHTVAVMQKWGL